MGVYIKGMEMPTSCDECPMFNLDIDGGCYCTKYFVIRKKDQDRPDWCPLVPVPPHGDLIDRDALIKDGWLNLHKEVIRMGGYAVHELPLKNPSIPVIIPAEEGE